MKKDREEKYIEYVFRQEIEASIADRVIEKEKDLLFLHVHLHTYKHFLMLVHDFYLHSKYAMNP